MDRVSWDEWVKAILEAAQELQDAGFKMKNNPLTDETVFYNLIALSAAEWRKDDQVNEEGPGMGKALGPEESYSPLQIYMTTWGKEIPKGKDVTVINNEYVSEFQNIDKDELISLITTNPKLAAKAGIIVANSKKGFENWSTWDMVQDKDTQQYIEYAQKFSNTTKTIPDDGDPDRGIPEPVPGYEPETVPPMPRTPYIPPSQMSQYTSQVPLAAQDKTYGRVRQMLEAQVNKQKKQAGHTPYIPGVPPQVTFSDAVQAALKLLGR